jgi:hypothetical protein
MYVVNYSDMGEYWSSTICDEGSPNSFAGAYSLVITPAQFVPQYEQARFYGISVRLVQDL